MRKSAQSGFKLFFLVSDLLSTWKLPVVDGLEMRM